MVPHFAEDQEYKGGRPAVSKKRRMRRGVSNSKLNIKQEAKYLESTTCHDD
jgi:hypothetical protein